MERLPACPEDYVVISATPIMSDLSQWQQLKASGITEDTENWYKKMCTEDSTPPVIIY